MQGATLSVYRTYDNPAKIGTREHTKYAFGESNGKVFVDADAAFEHALTRGYLKLFYNNAMWPDKNRGTTYKDDLRQMNLQYRINAKKLITMKKHS